MSTEAATEATTEAAVDPDQAVRATDDPRVERLTRWSWIMVGLFFAAQLLAAFVGTAALSWLGLAEGQVIGEAGRAGWLVAGGVLLVELAPVAVGIALGARATRLGGAASAASAFAVNVLLAVYALTVQVVQMVAG